MGRRYFPSVPIAMYHLCVHGMFLDGIAGVMTEVAKANILCAIVLGLVVLLTAMTMVNMLIGVMCEVMSRVATEERDRMKISFAKAKVKEAMECMDVDRDNMLTIDEFR